MRNLKIKLKNFFKLSYPTLFILGVVIVFFWKFFFKGLIPIPADFIVGANFPWLDYKWGYVSGVPVKNPITTDVVSFTYPMQILAVNLLKQGDAPLWNPLILMGTPLFANFQSSPFSPTNFVYFFFDKITAWSFQVILQHVLAALFTFLLLRSWNLSKLGSVLGGIVFSFGGYSLIWSQWNGHTLSASFFPLVIFLCDKWIDFRNWKIGILLSLSLMLFFLSGYPQSAIYLSLSIFVLWVIKIRNHKDWFLRTIFLAAFILIGTGLSAIQLVPGWELLNLSQRSTEPHPYEWTFLPPEKVITFIAPDFFGNHSTQNYWGPQDYTSNTGFVGVVAFVLSLFSLAFVRKSKIVLFASILILASLILAFPTPLSIFLWKSGMLGLNAASAHRSLILWSMGISILAAFGFDNLRYGKKWLVFILPFALILGFCAYAFLINSQVGLRNLVLPLSVLIFSFLIVNFFLKIKNALIGLCILEIFYFGWKFTPFSERQLVFPSTPVLDFIIDDRDQFRITASKVIPINMRMPFGIESVEGYDAVYPLRTAEFLAALNSEKSGTMALGRYGLVDNDTSPLLDLLNVKYYVTLFDKDGKVPERYRGERFKLAFYDKSVAVMKSTTFLPRSFFVDRWEVIKNDLKILDRLLDPEFNFSKVIILEEDPPDGTVGFMFTSDTFYPGWVARVNGREEKIYRANYNFRAVRVTSSRDVVTYSYKPESFRLGIKLSLFSLVLLFIVVRINMRWTKK